MSNINVDDNIIEIKAILLGEISVGKTSLINVSIGMKFNQSERTTFAANFVQKIIKIGSQEYCVDLWDTAGQEKLKSLTKLFYKGSQIIIFVYDVTQYKSFERLQNWVEEIENNLDNKYICGIVGNKKDLFTHEEVNEKEARNYAKSKGMKFKLVSAKNDPKSFSDFLEELIKDGKDIFVRRRRITLVKQEKKNNNSDCKC